MTTWYRIGACALLVAAALVAVRFYGAARYAAGRADVLAEQAVRRDADIAAAFARSVAGDAGAAKAIEKGDHAQAASHVRVETVVRTIKEYIHDHPAPAVCAMPPDDPVLRELAAGVDQANAAARAVQGEGPGRAAAAGAR